MLALCLRNLCILHGKRIREREPNIVIESRTSYILQLRSGKFEWTSKCITPCWVHWSRSMSISLHGRQIHIARAKWHKVFFPGPLRLDVSPSQGFLVVHHPASIYTPAYREPLLLGRSVFYENTHARPRTSRSEAQCAKHWAGMCCTLTIINFEFDYLITSPLSSSCNNVKLATQERESSSSCHANNGPRSFLAIMIM